MTRRLTLALALLMVSQALACSKVPLTAPTQSTIVLSVSNTTAPVNGSIDVTATLTESSGTAVQNGTLVTFSTTLGSIDPREARTHNGSATVKLSVGSTSGTAQVSAVSGPAKVDKPIEIKIGGANIARLDLGASPTTLPSTGGTAQLLAIALDGSGNRLQGVQVFFSVDAGSLSSSSVVTDQAGEARTAVMTTRATKVTATAGGASGTSAATATVTLQVNVLPTVSIAVASGATPTEGQPVSFTVTVTPNASGSAVRDVTVNFGNRTASLGAVSGTTTVTNVYSSPGTFTVTATATDAVGERTSASTIVTVVAALPLGVTIGSPAATKVQTAIVFTATVTPTGVAIARYEWSFGDGTGTSTSGPSTSHVYGTTGHRIVTVTAVSVDGRSGLGRIEIIVTE